MLTLCYVILYALAQHLNTGFNKFTRWLITGPHKARESSSLHPSDSGAPSRKPQICFLKKNALCSGA